MSLRPSMPKQDAAGPQPPSKCPLRKHEQPIKRTGGITVMTLQETEQCNAVKGNRLRPGYAPKYT